MWSENYSFPTAQARAEERSDLLVASYCHELLALNDIRI